jgi:hypothetical protein
MDGEGTGRKDIMAEAGEEGRRVGEGRGWTDGEERGWRGGKEAKHDMAVACRSTAWQQHVD